MGPRTRKKRILLLVAGQTRGMNGENAISLNKSGKRLFYPGVPFLVDLQPMDRLEDGTIAGRRSRNPGGEI